MRVVFAGTPAFAVPPLQAILDAGHEVALVLTQPDRPAGRGLALAQSPIKQLALRGGLRVEQPQSLKSPEARQALRAIGADVMVVVAYGLILPRGVLEATRLGAINIHASLLPRWRGAAPIQRAIEAGDTESGITIMQLDEGLDTGPMLLTKAVPILPGDTAGTLHDRLMPIGAELVVECLRRLAEGSVVACPQPAEGATYAKKIAKGEAVLDWRGTAADLERKVRAFNPAPGTTARLRDQELKIWLARALTHQSAGVSPGTVVSIDQDGPVVACGAGTLRLLELQRAGGKRMAAADVLRGFSIDTGERFELP